MELKILDMLQTIHTPFLDSVMIFASSIGNIGLVWIIIGIMFLIFQKTRKAGYIVLAALILDAIICNGILKPLIARVRPCDVNNAVTLLIARPKDYSFPSGHTSASFAAVSAMFYAGRKKEGYMALVLACIISFSRMYLYVHYPTDILAGIVLGVLCGFIALRIVENIRSRKKSDLAAH